MSDHLGQSATSARVYVDRLPERGWGRWNGGAHMLANDLDALHAMADKIGLRRAWFQGESTFPHYDLTMGKRALAVVAGAIEIEAGEIPDDVLMLNRSDGTYERRCDRLARRAKRAPGPTVGASAEHTPRGQSDSSGTLDNADL